MLRPIGKNKNCSLRFYILNLLSGDNLRNNLAIGVQLRGLDAKLDAEALEKKLAKLTVDIPNEDMERLINSCKKIKKDIESMSKAADDVFNM